MDFSGKFAFRCPSTLWVRRQIPGDSLKNGESSVVVQYREKFIVLEYVIKKRVVAKYFLANAQKSSKIFMSGLGIYVCTWYFFFNQEVFKNNLALVFWNYKVPWNIYLSISFFSSQQKSNPFPVPFVIAFTYNLFHNNWLAFPILLHFLLQIEFDTLHLFHKGIHNQKHLCETIKAKTSTYRRRSGCQI